jgi:hypothetical protein
MRISALRRGLVLGVVTLGLFGSSACFGSFQATKKVYAFNKGVGDKWVVEVVFLAMNIVPVYSIAAFADAVVFNSIEFWTGENPMSSVSLSEQQDGTSIRQTRTVSGDTRMMTLEEIKAGQVVSTTTISHKTGTDLVSLETKFADGRVESRTITQTEAGPVVSER